MLLIGLGNRARQGKDTAAEAILDHYDRLNERCRPHSYQRVWRGVNVGVFKFATALYQEVNEFLVSDTGKRWLARENRRETFAHILNLPEWVQPDPNPEVSELAPYGKHPKLLQWWGTEFRRAQDPDYWVKKLFASISSNLDIALVTDVRFPNEAAGIKQRGGYNVKVTRIQEDGTQYHATDRPSNHPSETALDFYNFDFRLINSEGHEALLGEQAITLAEYLRGLSK
jgi:hypothetical protein